jgi:predicted RNA-binding Zn-ribbon protein involved in translation (DUF1610 family)
MLGSSLEPLYVCPKCGWDSLKRGEAVHDDIAYVWQYCEDCDWRGDVIRCQLIKYPYGTAYKIDPTIVRPDVALFQTLRGKLSFQFESAARTPAISPRGSTQTLPSAPCPRCGNIIEQQHDLRTDGSAYDAWWSCPGCGFHSEAPTIHAPGKFKHSSDYSRITWIGKAFVLGVSAAAFLKILHQHYLAGDPDVPLSEWRGRPKDWFRGPLQELWGSKKNHETALIIPGARKGTRRLNL